PGRPVRLRRHHQQSRGRRTQRGHRAGAAVRLCRRRARRRARPASLMSSRARVFSSSVGMKLLIGVTGLALFVYLVVHIIGNLMVFLGPAAFNKYAFTLEG